MTRVLSMLSMFEDVKALHLLVSELTGLCLALLPSMASEAGPSQLGPTRTQGSCGFAIFFRFSLPIAV